ncbi:MAG: helix-hairpin-helix domain-containing protein [Planctomycetes bacterium]|jgi:predicted DNA-binding helix-hairpin-helix protein|nr:helix-hairpin-helix domain-containing protein [Planctomycetota bacterium]
MTAAHTLDRDEKLRILADDSRYDLACACGTRGGEDHRTRGPDGLWLYPTSVPRGGKSVLLKTLLSNVCAGDCLYCPLRRDHDVRRCALAPEDVAAAFMAFFRRGEVYGLFLSSGITGSPDRTMDRLVATGRILRQRHGFRGHLHLKIIPGASDAAVEAALSVASAVSLNVETPTRSSFAVLSREKDYDRDIVRTVKLIGRLTARGGPCAKVRPSTQFVVGASTETDAQIVTATARLYGNHGVSRAYFSAYQRGLGHPDLPGERRAADSPGDGLTREHRLYQADWLLRQYGFSAEEIPFGADGNLDLGTDPKKRWADLHPERFPVAVNRAAKGELLRVPGLGPTAVKRILAGRKEGRAIRRLGDLGKVGRVLRRAAPYLRFD